MRGRALNATLIFTLARPEAANASRMPRATPAAPPQSDSHGTNSPLIAGMKALGDMVAGRGGVAR